MRLYVIYIWLIFIKIKEKHTNGGMGNYKCFNKEGIYFEIINIYKIK